VLVECRFTGVLHVAQELTSFSQMNSTGKALSWFMGGSRDTVARNAAGRASPSFSPRLTLAPLTDPNTVFTDLVRGNVVLRPGIHILAYGASGLLTYVALFLHPGSFFLLLPMLFLAFTGGPGYRRIIAVDHSLRGMLLGSSTIVSLLALSLSLLIWIARDDAPPKSENDDGNDVSDQLSDFDQYALCESLPFSRYCRC
jgi:hypothetical protein